MDMTIDVNAVNFVEHAELLDVVLTKMQPGHILHVDVADTEYAFLKTNDELFYINIDDHITPYAKRDVIAFINDHNPYEEKASRADITAPQTIDDNIDEYDKILNYHRNIEFNNFLGYDRYEINDVTILKDLFEAKILADILDLRNPNAEPIGFTATVELVNSYIDRYNRLHKASCRTVSDVADFEIMRIRAGHEYSLGDL